MKNLKVDEKTLDLIIEKMVSTVEYSKKEIFEIGEQSRSELEQIKAELENTKALVKQTIAEGEKLQSHFKNARVRLSEVSQNFKKYSEKEVRTAYEKANDLQIKLSINQQQEHQLRNRRDELDRRLRNLESTVKRAETLAGQVSVVFNYLNSDIKQMNEMITDAKQKQEFGLKIIEAQEDERRRLSREIHDGPAQMLANVMMRSELIDRISREQGMDEALQEIRSLRGMVRSALYEVRKIIYDLRPMALDDLGLIPTLKRYLGTVEEYYNIRIIFLNNAAEKRFDPKLEVALFRLIQEAVQNACKHSKATKIEVEVELSQNDMKISVKDDGVGFDTVERKSNSFGLIGMKERVDLLKGEIDINSMKNKGTKISILVPLTKEQN